MYKMCLLIAEITSALALIIVVKRASEQNEVLVVDSEKTNNSQDEAEE